MLEPGDVALLEDLDLRLDVNDEPRQRDNTANMLYRPAETLTELTEFCNLSPGDVLLTGTRTGASQPRRRHWYADWPPHCCPRTSCGRRSSR